MPVEGGVATIDPGEVDLMQEVVEGWGVASEGAVTVALELDRTPELVREGLARELVRLIQDGRRAAGLAVTDRIGLSVEASGDVAEALRAHRGPDRRRDAGDGAPRWPADGRGRSCNGARWKAPPCEIGISRA